MPNSDYEKLLTPLKEARERLAESLMGECRRAVSEVAYKCGLSKEEREGLDSLCCLKVLNQAGNVNNAAHLSRLVWKISHSVVVDAIRTRNKSPDALNRAPAELIAEKERDGEIDERFEEISIDEMRKELLAALTPQQRVFSVLYWEQNLTLKQIGETMSVSESRAFQIKKAILSRVTVIAKRMKNREERGAKNGGEEARAS